MIRRRKSPTGRSRSGPARLIPRGGPKDAPAVLLCTVPGQLADVSAPDPVPGRHYPHAQPPTYPASAHRSMPPRHEFFTPSTTRRRRRGIHHANRSVEVRPYGQDYGEPSRLPARSRYPDRVTALVGQRQRLRRGAGQRTLEADSRADWKDADQPRERQRNAAPFSTSRPHAGTSTHTASPASEVVSPDGWTTDPVFDGSKGTKDPNLDLFEPYGSKPPHIPAMPE